MQPVAERVWTALHSRQRITLQLTAGPIAVRSETISDQHACRGEADTINPETAPGRHADPTKAGAKHTRWSNSNADGGEPPKRPKTDRRKTRPALPLLRFPIPYAEYDTPWRCGGNGLTS